VARGARSAVVSLRKTGAVPELPEMQALGERLDAALAGAVLVSAEPLGFAGLKTVSPGVKDLTGRAVEGVTRRGKYLVLAFDGGLRVLVHLAQAGRLDIEPSAKVTRPRGAIFRMRFDDGSAILVREHGTERSAGWWILGPGDDGPLGALGPEVDGEDFRTLLLESDDNRRLHTVLRDQRFATGIGRGYADDALNRAGLSPFSSLRSLDLAERERLLAAVDETLAAALEEERQRTGGLSAARLGERFAVHNRAGEPCPRCGAPLARVSYASHEVVYCPVCQTGGRTYADRRLSRLLR
jgi:formamidopyrimidine-DNA glycosylase